MYFRVNFGNIAPRKAVYDIMKQEDAEGLETRFHRPFKRRTYCNPGPNHAWHMGMFL